MLKVFHIGKYSVKHNSIEEAIELYKKEVDANVPSVTEIDLMKWKTYVPLEQIEECDYQYIDEVSLKPPMKCLLPIIVVNKYIEKEATPSITQMILA